MPKITILEESVINKIAAGEVIERPASVVKELVENAIDADATHITVDVEEGGKTLIKVRDNGCGMTTEDAMLCMKRHATSKISTADDLSRIKTLGFRGEGLASIVAVANVVLRTKAHEQDIGVKIVASSCTILKKETIPMQQGTIVEVFDLFVHVPARKKHLKTMHTELRQITLLMTKYALAYPNKTFLLLHHGNELLFAPAAEPLDNLITLFGKNVAYGMIPVDYRADNIHVTGFIGKPTLTRQDKTFQHIFVNKRPIRNNIIVKAVVDAYHTLLHLERQPVFVLDASIDPAIIDVNVHPQKTTMRIENEHMLYSAFYRAVRATLDRARLMPVVSEKQGVQAPLIAQQFHVTERHQTAFVEYNTKTASLSPQHILERAMEKMGVADIIVEKKTNEQISTLQLLGCIHDVFFIAQNELGLVIIDQHAAHERVLYEKFMQQFQEKSIVVQELLEPEQMEFSPTELLLLKEHRDVLQTLGFMLEEFGGKTFLLRSIPAIFGNHVKKDVIYDVLAGLSGKTAVAEFMEEKIIRQACRAAVKANDIVHVNEMKKILHDLEHCQQPYTCPHGRPTMIQFTIPDLERKFKRVV
jgi:DNA mismatch repair protein MutL